MVININKTTKKEVNCLNINGNEETDPAILSQTFNSFFFNNCILQNITQII